MAIKENYRVRVHADRFEKEAAYTAKLGKTYYSTPTAATSHMEATASDWAAHVSIIAEERVNKDETGEGGEWREIARWMGTAPDHLARYTW